MAKNAMTTKKETNALAKVIPFEDFGSMGFDTIDTQDYATPRLKALMALSPEVQDETVPGAKAGMIYNSVTEELYSGEPGIRVIPCGFAREYVEWSKYKEQIKSYCKE